MQNQMQMIRREERGLPYVRTYVRMAFRGRRTEAPISQGGGTLFIFMSLVSKIFSNSRRFKTKLVQASQLATVKANVAIQKQK